MTYLEKEDDETREAWLMYAVALGRRGLWPKGIIETHSPHGRPDAECIWGTAECEHMSGQGVLHVQFATPQAEGRTRWDIRGLRVEDEPGYEGLHGPVRYPLLRWREMPPEWRARVRAARLEGRTLRHEAELERAEVQRRRAAVFDGR